MTTLGMAREGETLAHHALAGEMVEYKNPVSRRLGTAAYSPDENRGCSSRSETRITSARPSLPPSVQTCGASTTGRRSSTDTLT